MKRPGKNTVDFSFLSPDDLQIIELLERRTRWVFDPGVGAGR